jgi:SAM-dependent methyltransferase
MEPSRPPMPSPPPAPSPSAWITRWSHLVPAGARVLDVACGSGRHVRWFASRGCQVTALDRDVAATSPLHGLAEVVVADIERSPWPLPGLRFDAIVVTNYLWRGLLPLLTADVLGESGVLIYETFGQGQQTLGKPSNPDFLLYPGELLRAADGLHVVAYENGFLEGPDRFVQRLVAVKHAFDPVHPQRHPLASASVAEGG